MAKRRGPLGQLLIGFILLLIVAAGAGIGLAIFYDDDAFASQLRSAGLPEAQIAKVLDMKARIKDKADIHPADAVFVARSIWWDTRDTFDLNLTDQVTRNLPRVRHVTQTEAMARPDDPKEPHGEEKTDAPMMAEGTQPETAAPEAQPEQQMAEPQPGGESLPSDIQREGGEQPQGSGETAAAMPETPGTMPDSPTTMPEPAAEEKPMAEAAPAPEPMAPAEPAAPAAPEATDKPMDLNNPPAPVAEAAEPAPAAPEPAQETATVPPAAATPAAPPPATAEERIAEADLTYKRALALFANAKTNEEKAEAAKLFAQAAIGGHPGAQYSIGVMHYNGTGVAKDYAKAAEWFGRAAEKSNAAAQYNLGILYYNGQGVPKDDRLAYKWISAAAENGDQKAIVARDALKKALPADVTKPAAPTFDSGLPASSPAGPGGTPIEIAPTK